MNSKDTFTNYEEVKSRLRRGDIVSIEGIKGEYILYSKQDFDDRIVLFFSEGWVAVIYPKLPIKKITKVGYYLLPREHYLDLAR